MSSSGFKDDRLKIKFKMNIGKSKVNMNMSNMYYRSIKAGRTLIDNIVLDTEEYVPYLTGRMNDTAIDDMDYESSTVKYNTPYARRQYYYRGDNRTLTYHPHATSKWFEVSKSINMKKWEDEVKRVYREG